MSLTDDFDDVPPDGYDEYDVPFPDEDVPPSYDVPSEECTERKRLGLKLSDTAPYELFPSEILDTKTHLTRETTLDELLSSPLQAPAMTVEATEKQVGGAVAAILDGRLRRDRNGAWWAAMTEGWREVTAAQVAALIKSLIGRPDPDDNAVRAVIPFLYRKPTKDDILQLLGSDNPRALIPEPADRWAEGSDTVRRIREDLEGRKSIYVGEAFDADPLLINAGGLVIDLRPSIVDEITARPLSRRDLISKSMGVRFDPNAECPRWLRHVQEIMSVTDPDTKLIHRRPEMERFLQVTAGLTLIGETVEQVVMIYHAQSGQNGKSVYANALSHVFGSYSATLPKAALMEKRAESHTTDLTVLDGARFGYAKETKRTRWDAELLKDLASHERYAARRLYENNKEITPSHTLHISTNNLPLLPSGDAAVWRRVKIVNFRMRWWSDGDRPEERAVSVGPVDVNLPKALEAESAGILNWLLDGLRMYYADGCLKVPEAVRQATEAARRSSSLWAEFAIEHFEATDDDSDTVPLADIWKLWTHYKTEHSQHATLAPTGTKDVQAAVEAEMPGVRFASGREPGERKTTKHFKRVTLTEAGEALRNALVGTGTDGVVLPFTSRNRDAAPPFTADEESSK